MLSGQTYRFRNYGIENNLPSRVIYTLTQDNSGYLWIGTTEGLIRFDGINFYRTSFPDSAGGRLTTFSMKDSRGRIWFGCNDGTIFYTTGKELKQVSLPGSQGTGISSIVESPDGSVYVFPQRKPVYRVSSEESPKAVAVGLGLDQNIFSAAFINSNNLLLGTQENLVVCRLEKDSLAVIKSVEGFDYSRIMSINPLPGDSGYLIGTDGNGLFRLKLADGSETLSRFRFPGLESITVKSVTRDRQDNFWVATSGNGAIRMRFAEKSDSLLSVQVVDKTSGLPGDNVMAIFQDSEDNIWLGFNGDGLSMLGTDAFKFLVPGEKSNIIFTGKLNGDYVLGTPEGFYLFDLVSGKSKSFTSVLKLAGRSAVSTYFIDDEKNLWIGTEGSGLFMMDRTGKIQQFYRSGDTGADFINSVRVRNDNIWLATLNGVYIISKEGRSQKKHYDINEGLPSKGISQIFLNNDGSAYIANESERLYRIDPDSGVIAMDAVMYGTLLNKMTALAKDSKGNIWIATYGNGVFEFQGDSIRSLNTSGGLLSNYTYSILADRNDNIWIGHERGISRYNPATGITKVYSTDFANGGLCNPEGMYESPDGLILIGTTEGLITYDRNRDRQISTAPVNNINSITINDVEYPYRQSFSLPYNYKKRYTVRVNYTGIYLSNPEKVYYSTFMENYDNDWTAPSSNREVSYNLRDGKYRFNMMSVNEDGLSQENPVSFEINIKKPVWRTWWFILAIAGIATGVVILIVRQREKAQKKIQEYLEKELEARTAVVRKQKAEIELQNLEITDSINYAKRIQSSILPDVRKLKEHFRDAFIMLYPRDIVSGDFYWFDKFDDDRYILVCADSTGHGVPGAFMSMIGSTLLQDIVSRQRISKPSEILTMLDKQVFTTLNQNLEAGVSNDGMDIIVCEFSHNNRHIRFASAMRPVILFLGGEILYVKGNRASVGGQSVVEKYFDDQEYYLGEGDAIYMFSDGFPDQFGGPDGKKMKIARLKKLVSEVASLPVDRQEEMLTAFFKEWKGRYDQVDDVLFMGVKV